MDGSSDRNESEEIRGKIRDAIEAIPDSGISPIARALGRILVSSHYGEESAIPHHKLFPQLETMWKWTERRKMTLRDVRQAKRDLFDAGIPVTGNDHGYFIIRGTKEGGEASAYLAAKGTDLMAQSSRMRDVVERFFGRQLAFV